ncbi:MAG: 3-hydroxyacyl-CoA dehydrogenase NAD-binding domain-containing protein [Thermodesulfobacteriota bacterium]
MEIKKVGVVGMGTMGTQIGIVSARGGYETVIVDLSEELIRKGQSSMKSFLVSQVKKGKMKNEEMDKVFTLIRTTTDLAMALSDVSLVRAGRLGRKSGRGVYDYQKKE